MPVLPALIATSILLVGMPCLANADSPSERWVSTWAAPPVARVDQPAQTLSAAAQGFPWARDVPASVGEATPGQELDVGGGSSLHFKDQTLRQVARVSVGGARVRVVLANTFGTQPLRIGAAQVALRDKGAAITAGSNRVLTFGGITQPLVPAGALLVSDPVDLAVPDFADLVVDIYLPDDTAAGKSPVTFHPASWQVNYVSEARQPCRRSHVSGGRHNGLPPQRRATIGLLVLPGRVEVEAPQVAGLLVAFGDSITDGTQSGIDQNLRWPDLLAGRLAAAGIRMSVVNGGIGGGRVLEDGVGPNALARFDRDVLAQPGVTHVTVLEGVNDIGVGGAKPSPSVAELISWPQAAHRARSRSRPADLRGDADPVRGRCILDP